MAWQDILAGLAGGLSQGLGQVQQNVESRRRGQQVDKELLLRQLADQRAADEQARQALVQQYGLMEPGISEIDPTDPMVKAVGITAFTKAKTPGKLTRKKSAQDELADINLQNTQANQPLEAMKRGLEMQQIGDTQALMADLQKQFGDKWQTQLFSPKVPMEVRQAIGAQLRGKPDFFMTPQEKLQFSEQVAAAAQTAAAMAPLRQAQAGNFEDQRTLQLSQQFNDYLKGDAGQLHLYRNKMDLAKTQNEWLQQQRSAGLVPSSLKVTSFQEIK